MFDSMPPQMPRPTLSVLDLDGRPRNKAKRWWAGALVSGCVHVLPVALVLYSGFFAPKMTPIAEPAFAVELIQFQAPPEPPSQQPDGPKQLEATAAARPDTINPRPVEAEALASVEPLPLPAQEPVKNVQVSYLSAPETTAPASLPAPPAPQASNAPQDWQSQILSHLETHKRYPASARNRRAQGVPYVRFVMDRRGRVLSSRLERSSGHADLDREAISLPKRAEPLPQPPEEIAGDAIEMVVPIEFFMKP